jgi:RNA polymerase sigma-70 factor (ECF subfamily)
MTRLPIARTAEQGDTMSTAQTFSTHDTTSGVVHGRFRRRSSCDDSQEQQRAVARAVERAKQGDQEALRFLYVTYADNVFGYVSSVVRDHHEAEDVTQHVFFKLMKVLPKYEQREVPFSAWILRVARNVAVDHLRQRRALPVEEVRPVDAPGDDDAGLHRRLSLTEALATLPDEQREVLVLRHLIGLSPTEIADRMGRSEPSIHGLHHRGRGALRVALEERHVAPAVAA